MLERLAQRPWLQIALVMAIAAFVYLPFLGVRPLDFSEGHRAVPGWTMLESHDYWHVKMFGLTYIRKPPGMPWAIAASSAVFGETPFAARLPSAICAILMSVVAWWYGRRWFGNGLAAGLAQALMPLMWSPGRTAEIEMLNNFGTQLFALGLIDLLVGAARKGAQSAEDEPGPFGFLRDLGVSARDVLLPAAGLFIAALAKGPASAPVLGGVLIGACLAARSLKPLAQRAPWLALLFGACVTAVIGFKVFLANNDPDAVREDVAGQFLWSGGRVLGVLSLAPLAFASALPMSLALILPFMQSPRGLAGAEVAHDTPRIAPALAWAWLISVSLLILSGVSNARYAMPAAVLLPPLASSLIGMAAVRFNLSRPSPIRRLLEFPLTWAGVLLMGAWWFVALTSISPTEDQQAGLKAAELLAGTAQDGELWADDAIEARPDILWRMHRLEPQLQVRWAKANMRGGELPAPLAYLLVRIDNNSPEKPRYLAPARRAELLHINTASVRRLEFALFRVVPVAPPRANGESQPMPRTPEQSDFPVPFGYKMSWIAVSSGSADDVIGSLALKGASPCPWQRGVKLAYEQQGVFVTPNVRGWAFVLGDLPEVNKPELERMLMSLSDRFGTAMYFGTHRVVEYHAWARAEQGKLVRAFGYVGEAGEFISNRGSRTKEEIELAIGEARTDHPPNEEDVLKLAAKWSLDPREFGANTPAPGTGRFAPK